MQSFTGAEKIVVKVGTSSLTYSNGKLNIRHIEELCRTLSDLQNSGRKMVLVSSGAVGVGMGKLKIDKRPDDMAKKQAIAAVGQCELMFLYDKLFGEYNQTVAQVLLTADDIEDEARRENIINTFEQLLEMNIIPIVNENDTVSIAEMDHGNSFGDNDRLSAVVSSCIGADALIILTDIDGMYDDNPKVNPDAKRIPFVEEITDEIEAIAGGSGSQLGTGGMSAKVKAAKLATEKGIHVCVMSGAKPGAIHFLCEGGQIGTVFKGKKEEK